MCLRDSDIPIFYGYVVNMTASEDTITYEAVDQVFYLKNKESYVFSGKTATQIFKAICEEDVYKRQIQIRIINSRI